MAPSTEPSAEMLAFLQRRVGLFGLVAGALALSFFLFRVAQEPSLANLAHPSMLTHAGAALLLMGMRLLLRGAVRSLRFIRTVETSGLILASALLVIMGAYLPIIAQPGRIVLMALAVVHLARALYVPSSARHTALIEVVTGIVIVLFEFEGSRKVDLELFEAIAPEIARMTELRFALYAALDAGAWWALFGALAVAASKVIYGLRKQVGQIRALGQYHIEAEIGAGGMGIVYRAQHALLRRETAVKLLPPERAGEATIQRFEREVKLTARLKHPNTVTIYDYGRTPDGIFYYAMELLEGANLEEIVEATGPFPSGRVVRVLERAAGALAEAHELGLVHRDIKPSNIMLCNQGGMLDVVKVLDFGLVKEVRSENPKLTLPNVITGTPLYMAPEAVMDGDSVDARSDLYALGCVAYYLLVGDHVFTGGTMVEVCSKHLHAVPEAPSVRAQRQIPASLERLVLDCLEKEPDRRPQSARELLERLAQVEAEAWDRKRAEAWWREHRGRLSGPRTAPVEGPGTSRTIQVDFALRLTQSPSADLGMNERYLQG